MGVVIISTLQRGANGTSPFPISVQDDLRIPHVIVPDIAARDAIPEWKRISFMTCYVIGDTTYRLGVDTTIAGQVWTVEGSGGQFQLLSEKNQANGYVGLNAEGFIDPQYIRSILVQDYYVVNDEAERLALVTKTGDICNQLDNNTVYLKKNNNTPPTTNADWADITPTASVSSVNGQTGAVSIDFNGLLGWLNNQTEFEVAVGLTPAISQLNSAVAINTADIAAIYALLAGLTGDAESLALWDNTKQYQTGNVVLFDPGSGRKNLYRCTAPPAIGVDPTNIAYWELIGDFYTRAEIDTMMAGKADLVNGTVPLSQLDLNAITRYYVVADQAALVALQPSLQVDDRVMVMEAQSNEVPDGGVGEYIYKPGDPNADGLGFVFFSAASTDAFDWNRPVKKAPSVGDVVTGASIGQGLENAFFGPVFPTITFNDIPLAEVGSSSQALISGEVVPQEADSIDEIRIVKVSDGSTLTTVPPATPPTATPISYDAPAETMILGATENYRIEVDYTIGTRSGTVISETKAFEGVYPIFVGNGAAGLTGAQIYGLTKVLAKDVNYFHEAFVGSERIYFAFPDDYNLLVKIEDQHKDSMFGSLFSDTPAVVSITSTLLLADWTRDYKVYESQYDSITDSERYGFLWNYEEAQGQGDGLSGSDKAKLDSIEFGAQVNPSANEIKILYESNNNTNEFDDGEKVKLAGIETGAQVNQDDATVKTQYENNADTNAFTDTDKAKLDGLDLNLVGDMKESVYVQQNPNAGPAVDRAVEMTGAALNQTGTDIPAGRYLVVTDVNLAGGYATVRPADNTLNDTVDAIADTLIPAGDFGRIGVIAYNSNIDTTGQNIGDPVYLGQNGTVTFTPPTTGSLIDVGKIYHVGNPGFIASLRFVNKLAESFQEDWRPNTFYRKNTMVSAADPSYPELGNYLIRSKNDFTSSAVLDPDRPGFFDDWELMGGDMKNSLYDPLDVNGDVFDMNNMRDGSGVDPNVVKVAMTQAERNKLSGLEDPTFKGYFLTPNELNTVYPVGQTGWSAIVIFENDGTTPNGNLWNWVSIPGEWQDSGITGIGGDMNKSVYDPTNVNGDSFLMDNFNEGSDPDKKFFTQAEKSKLAAFSPATAYYLKTETDALLALKADLTYVDAQDNLRMLTTLYDPNTIAGDVFDMENMVEGATKLILTAAERANIANNTSLAHTHANKALLDTITDAGDGEAYLANDGVYKDAAKAGIHNGTLIEQQQIFIVEESGTVYADVEKVGGGDIPVYFGNNSYLLNCTSGGGVGGRARVTLTQGTPQDAQINLIYVWLNGGVPELAAVLNIDNAPSEFAFVGLTSIRDAANVAIEGPISLQRFTDAATHNDRGRLAYLGERLRVEGSRWWQGVDPTVTITPSAGALDGVGLTVLTGTVYQLHRQTFPALDIATDSIYIARVSGAGSLQNYQKVLNLNQVLEYADGSVIQDGDYYNLVVYGVINQDQNQCKLFVNPSQAGYTTANSAYNDQNNFANLSCDEDLRTVAFLIARIPLRYTAANNGTIEFINPAGEPEIIDLRGEAVDVRDESGTGQSPAQIAEEVVVTPAVGGNTNVQAVLEDHESRIARQKIYSAGMHGGTNSGAALDQVTNMTLDSGALNMETGSNGLKGIAADFPASGVRVKATATGIAKSGADDEDFEIQIRLNGAANTESSVQAYQEKKEGEVTITTHFTFTLASATDVISVWTAGSSVDYIKLTVQGLEI